MGAGSVRLGNLRPFAPAGWRGVLQSAAILFFAYVERGAPWRRVYLALAVVLAATTLCGRLAMAVKQPRVVGEMVAGVLLGPALLGAVAPGVQAQVFPTDVKDTLYVLSTIGLTFYMFLVGSSLDHGLAAGRNMRRASALAVSGILPTFALGAGAAALFFGSLSPDGATRWVTARGRVRSAESSQRTSASSSPVAAASDHLRRIAVVGPLRKHAAVADCRPILEHGRDRRPRGMAADHGDLGKHRLILRSRQRLTQP